MQITTIFRMTDEAVAQTIADELRVHGVPFISGVDIQAPSQCGVQPTYIVLADLSACSVTFVSRLERISPRYHREVQG